MPSRYLAYITTEKNKFDAALESSVQSMPALLVPVLRHALLDGGKRVRPALASLSARLACASLRHKASASCMNSLVNLGVALEMLHGASLLHDDLVDSADIRRGKEAAHKKFGVGTVVLAGDVLLARAVELVAELGQAELSALFAKAIVETAAGEVAELSSLRDINCSEAHYLSVIEGKTAWLLRASCELGTRLALFDAKVDASLNQQISRALAEYGHNLGMAFQIVDDALDFAPSSKDTGKPIGGDLREAKFTAPVRFYYESLGGPEQKSFALHFAKADFSQSDIEHISSQIRKLGFVEKTREQAAQYLQKAEAALSLLPGAHKDCAEYGVLLGMLEYIRLRSA